MLFKTQLHRFFFFFFFFFQLNCFTRLFDSNPQVFGRSFCCARRWVDISHFFLVMTVLFNYDQLSLCY